MTSKSGSYSSFWAAQVRRLGLLWIVVFVLSGLFGQLALVAHHAPDRESLRLAAIGLTPADLCGDTSDAHADCPLCCQGLLAVPQVPDLPILRPRTRPVHASFMRRMPTLLIRRSPHPIRAPPVLTV